MIIWESFHEYFSISKSDYYCHLGVTVDVDPKRCFDLFWSKFKKVLSVMTWIKANLMKKCGHQDSIIWRTMNLKIIFGWEWNDNCRGFFLDISLVLSLLQIYFGFRIDLTYKTWLHVSNFFSLIICYLVKFWKHPEIEREKLLYSDWNASCIIIGEYGDCDRRLYSDMEYGDIDHTGLTFPF